MTFVLYYPMKKYTYQKAIEISAMIDFGLSKAKVARRYGISRQTLYAWMDKLEKQMKTSSWHLCMQALY